MFVVSVDKELKFWGGDCHSMTVSAPLGGVSGSRMVMPRAVRSVVARAEPRVTERVCWPPSSVPAKSGVVRFIELTMGHTLSEGGHRLVEGQPTATDQAGHPAGDPSALRTRTVASF